MPSTTSLGPHSFYNAGPLTTTYTAPASCATVNTDHLMMGHRTAPDHFRYGVCAFDQGDCVPSGGALDSQNAKNGFRANSRFDYFSPGLHCPHGWATVGVATRNAEGVITSSGPAFTFASSTVTVDEDHTSSTFRSTSTAILESDMGSFAYPGRHGLLAAMDRGETAVMCCPSSMTANALNAPCFAALPSAEVRTKVCFAGDVSDYLRVSTQVSIFGTTVSAYLHLIPSTGGIPTITSTISSSERSELIAYTVVPMVALVHRASDTEYSTKTGEGESSSASKTPNGAAAMTGRPAFQMTFLGEVSPLVLTTLVGVAAGFALVLA
ncbi:hypothetical protein PG990_009022 [Apiospora arundinis]